jgi:hypothetical protein
MHTQIAYFEYKKSEILKRGRESSGNLGAFMSRNLRNHGTLSPLMIDYNQSAQHGGIFSNAQPFHNPLDASLSTLDLQPDAILTEAAELAIQRTHSQQKLYTTIPVNKFKANGVKVVDRYNHR